jgi:hypothetical protein
MMTVARYSSLPATRPTRYSSLPATRPYLLLVLPAAHFVRYSFLPAAVLVTDAFSVVADLPLLLHSCHNCDTANYRNPATVVTFRQPHTTGIGNHEPSMEKSKNCNRKFAK